MIIIEKSQNWIESLVLGKTGWKWNIVIENNKGLKNKLSHKFDHL